MDPITLVAIGLGLYKTLEKLQNAHLANRNRNNPQNRNNNIGVRVVVVRIVDCRAGVHTRAEITKPAEAG